VCLIINDHPLRGRTCTVVAYHDGTTPWKLEEWSDGRSRYADFYEIAVDVPVEHGHAWGAVRADLVPLSDPSSLPPKEALRESMLLLWESGMREHIRVLEAEKAALLRRTRG